MRLLASFFAFVIALTPITSAVAGSAGRCGGTGGNRTTTLTCPSGQYIAGIAARGGAFVDMYSIACRKIPVSGAAGSIGEFESAGPGGGTENRSGRCSNSKHAVRSLSFKSGAFVDRAGGGGCAPRDGDGWSGSTPTGIELGVGGVGGGNCSVSCPIGEALYKLTVKHGGWIDSIRGDCRK